MTAKMDHRGREEKADALRARYLHLTRVLLPQAAKAGRWAVRHDHCFTRIVLDHLFMGCWYNHVDRRKGPAIGQLSEGQLDSAIAIASGMLSGGDALVQHLDQQSLIWRGKRNQGRMKTGVPSL